jgi:site-specific DNA-methyltransferase (adenine-specific)
MGDMAAERESLLQLPSPYYEDEFVTLYCADNADVLPTLSGVDLVFTSPPYNLGISAGGGFGHYSDEAGLRQRGGGGKWTGGALAHGYHDHDDAMPLLEYECWQSDVLRKCWSVLSETGAIYYNHKPRVQAQSLWLPLDLNPGLPVRQIVTWARAGGINFAPTHYCPTYEWIVVFAKPDFRLKSKGASGVGDVWYVPQEQSEHPAAFPIGLPARAIESTAPSLVLDPFAGSGTTLRAAKDAGVRSIGIEKSERYCEIAVRRLAQSSLFGQAA